ncbi:GTP-binding protein 10-like [Scylla paramamosain]|uniref:GTP-binding protein 10-like n=1 Tax=Scylla paramamosain TaxID=85552 RepID=UPI0030834079
MPSSMWYEHWDKMKSVRSKFVDVLRLHVRGGAGGMGLLCLRGVGGTGGDVYVEGKEGEARRHCITSHSAHPLIDHFSPCFPSQTTSHPALPLTDHFSPCSPSHRPLLILVTLSQTTSHPAFPHRPLLTLLSLSQTTSHPALLLTDHIPLTLLSLSVSFPHRPQSAEAAQGSARPAAGAELTIPVPTGTIVWLEQHQKLLGEIKCAGDKVLVARGGQSSNPSNQYNGQKGQGHIVKLELKLLADVGLVGFPNAGKSTLLWAISRARPKVASYPFTTLQPTLGVVEYSDMRRLTIADLPGLIEGAWANVGMGHRFLRHVERTHFLLFVVDINGFRLSPKQPYRSPTENVMLVNRELELYSPDLLSKPALLMVNKMDSPNAESRLQELLHNIKRMEDYVLCCSCGAKLTENSWDNFVNISIPLSEASQLVTILGHPHLMVQTLRNPADLAFDLVTVRRSGCSGVGEDI